MESNLWVKCFSVVTFDEDVGQKVEFQVPAIMNEEQQQALAFLAFPDSNSFNIIGNLMYVFKMKHDPALFGYVYFRQQRDLTKPRKFFQKSLVLLSEHPYISLFRQVIEIVGPLYFDHGESIFEAINSCLRSWGNIIPGRTYELPMLGTVIVFTIPSTEQTIIPQLLGDGITDILDSMNIGHPGLFQDINLCELVGMSFIKKHLWSFWEVLICGETTLIVTDSPETCSILILGLLSLISPLIYSGEFHPYFTIFDPEFRTIQSLYEKKKLTDMVIGATNPYILKLFSDIDNVYQFEDRNGLQLAYTNANNNNIIPPYKPVLSQLFESSTKEVLAINNTTIRRHFRELTMSFLQPFQQYLSMDLTKVQESPFTPLSLKPFSEQEFLSFVNNSKNVFPLLKYTTRPKALSLYSRFVKSTTFNKWFASQRQKANGESDKVIRNAMYDFDVSRVFNMEKKERRVYYEKIKGRLMYEERVGENFEGINKLKHQLSLLGQNIARLNDTV